MRVRPISFFFFFNDTATTEIYTLPYTTLFRSSRGTSSLSDTCRWAPSLCRRFFPFSKARWCVSKRSEEHTSELQSHFNLVCRLLLEKTTQRARDASQQHLSLQARAERPGAVVR